MHKSDRSSDATQSNLFYVDIRLMHLYPLFPCLLWFADITYSIGTCDITLSKWLEAFMSLYNANGSHLVSRAILFKDGHGN